MHIEIAMAWLTSICDLSSKAKTCKVNLGFAFEKLCVVASLR
jgi:hypothetical protein